MRHSSFLFIRRFTNIHSIRRRLAVGFDDRGNGIMMFKNSKGVEVDLVNYGSYGVYFSAYNENGFVLSSGVKIIGPCAAFPRNALCWHVNNALDITEKSLSLFFMLEPPIEVLIIGKGETKSMVDYRRILDICWKHRLCVEVMPTVYSRGMVSLSDILLPWDHTQHSNSLFLTFKNADGCIVHVPVTTSNINGLRNSSESLVIDQLNQLMNEEFDPTVQEHGPHLYPGSTFFLDSNPRPRRKVNMQSQLISDMVSFEKEKSPENEENTVDLTTQSSGEFVDLIELEKLSNMFFNRRVEMNLSQTDVAQSLAKLYGVHRSVSLVSRFERMDLSLSNYLKVYPVLLRWLKDTETAEGRDVIIRAVVDSYNENQNSNNDNDGSGSGGDGGGSDNHETTTTVNTKDNSSSLLTESISADFQKRRPRTILPDDIKMELERLYRKNQRVSKYETKELSAKFNLDKKIIVSWFYNRRARDVAQQEKKMKQRRRRR
ncbi:unnamed protein product [Trichobilharzia szidati]|nr:unnamed protein product [Trichobilharzia szidati]